MGRISDYVNTLTPAERDQFKDLIEECTERESTIQHSAVKANAALQQLAEQQRLMCVKVRELQDAGQRPMETVSRMYLQTVPSPKRMH